MAAEKCGGIKSNAVVNHFQDELICGYRRNRGNSNRGRNVLLYGQDDRFDVRNSPDSDGKPLDGRCLGTLFNYNFPPLPHGRGSVVA